MIQMSLRNQKFQRSLKFLKFLRFQHYLEDLEGQFLLLVLGGQ